MKKLIAIFFILFNTLIFSQSRSYAGYSGFSNSMPNLEDAYNFFYTEWEANPADFPNKLSDIENLKQRNKEKNIEYIINKEKEVTTVKILINGKTFSESGYKNGLLDGTKKIFQEKGKIFQEIEYKNGKANGIAKVFNDRNDLVLETNYKNNLKEGLRRLTIPKRHDIIIEGNYVAGILKGELKISYENGVYYYPNDLKKGNVRYYADNKLLSEFSIFDGKQLHGDLKDYYPETGKLKIKTPYYFGDKNGFEEYYNPNGEFLYKNEYKFGKSVGEHKRYFFDKTLISEEYYDQDGLKTGVWKDYERSGVVASEKIYVNDKLEGTSKEFRNGILIESTQYQDGKRNGISKSFDQKTGVLKIESLYENDIRKNEKEYYPEGTVYKETDFSKDGRRMAVRYFDNQKKLLCENKWELTGTPIGTHKTYRTSKENKIYLDTEIEYNDKGEQIVNSNYNADGGYVIKHLKNGKWHGLTTVYSSKTNTTEEIYYFQSKKVTKEEFEKLNK
ncbi:Antitoxin component YwqK of the YwqJK toxin-antitoxin module [Flavobacterium resistens]|uniref:Antitoxin component YwqK of the YwqJK toxin-antitoxin module n=1 Tax=Flavobacterium resistens TaxID=443612 RepID=A0A521EE75_9FLAO|nr:hypothetical protein [Flavobacterium resistens]MRX68976.1 hypothetical protein [Flavobacterium resistens]SMO81480.1 Antitoxin component YwqK of the YwqJK toxin-antitoxin module [Flavobacterium resistens]